MSPGLYVHQASYFDFPSACNLTWHFNNRVNDRNLFPFIEKLKSCGKRTHSTPSNSIKNSKLYRQVYFTTCRIAVVSTFLPPVSFSTVHPSHFVRISVIIDHCTSCHFLLTAHQSYRPNQGGWKCIYGGWGWIISKLCLEHFGKWGWEKLSTWLDKSVELDLVLVHLCCKAMHDFSGIQLIEELSYKIMIFYIAICMKLSK